MTERSLGSEDDAYRGREFNTDSTALNIVFGSSYVPCYSLEMMLTAASHKLSKCGELGGIKLHCICLELQVIYFDSGRLEKICNFLHVVFSSDKISAIIRMYLKRSATTGY
ncbi:hypothetical protein RUM44_002006 [Polyplax serrata]|uniref:Uncharacterized protein n=1 Tax=Polyplax serrata TaxID=468196 RepID=A0ABR1ALN5_POLSC